jgi:hypothetical protein
VNSREILQAEVATRLRRAGHEADRRTVDIVIEAGVNDAAVLVAAMGASLGDCQEDACMCGVMAVVYTGLAQALRDAA